MSEKYVIVLGDKTSHGGTVITGDDVLSICDKPAARLGDKVTCPLHGPNEIIEGFHTVMLEPNKTLAYEGCKTAWQAIGSVIMNRGGKKRFLHKVDRHHVKFLTAEEVIRLSGFDAFSRKK